MASDTAVAAASGVGAAVRYAPPYAPGFTAATASSSGAASSTTSAASAPGAPAPAAAAPTAGSAPAASSNAPLVNPSLHVDLALNVVVLEFFNSKGDVTQSIPSQKQLQAYELQPPANTSVGSFTVG